MKSNFLKMSLGLFRLRSREEKYVEPWSVKGSGAFGVWKDRQDMKDPVKYVRRIRRGRKIFVWAVVPTSIAAAASTTEVAVGPFAAEDAGRHQVEIQYPRSGIQVERPATRGGR